MKTYNFKKQDIQEEGFGGHLIIKDDEFNFAHYNEGYLSDNFELGNMSERKAMNPNWYGNVIAFNHLIKVLIEENIRYFICDEKGLQQGDKEQEKTVLILLQDIKLNII